MNQKTQIADTIRQQVGPRALYMIGAKNFATMGSNLSFKVGRNRPGFTHVDIELTPDDLYTVTFYRIRAHKVAAKEQYTGIYADMLTGLIADTTKMVVSL
jgi:hypothetical protein